MTDRIISAIDIAVRDSKPNVKEWIRVTSIQMKMEKGLPPVTFNGEVRGNDIFALISNGRWVAICDCGAGEYVDPINKLFFCMNCGNHASGYARPVKFPFDWKEIENILLKVEMVKMDNAVRHVAGRLKNSIANEIIDVFNARPAYPQLRRDWAPSKLKNNPLVNQSVILKKYGETSKELEKRIEEESAKIRVEIQNG